MTNIFLNLQRTLYMHAFMGLIIVFGLLASISLTQAKDSFSAQAETNNTILIDPSTWNPYSCVQTEDITYKINDLGKIRGRVYRPVRDFCTNSSPPPAESPVVLLLNGQGYFYYDYDYLARHLAGNGFVVLSVETIEDNPHIFCGAVGICIEDRARKGIAYLKEFQQDWTWTDQVDFSNVTLLGHSRGGEAVVDAASIIRWEEAELGNPGVRAVISLAPTDVGADGLSDRRRLLGRESPNFLVVYGSRDEQVKGWSSQDAPIVLPHKSGFALYDRAGTESSLEGFPISLDNQIERSMQFIYKANHNQFSDRSGSSSACWHSVLPQATQHKLAKGLVNAYLLWKVWGLDAYRSFFDGTFEHLWGEDTWPQFSDGKWHSRRVIDNFQNSVLGSSTIGGNLSVNGNLEAEVVDNWDTDYRSMHGPADGMRLKLTHDQASPSNILQWNIPANKSDVDNFTHLSFRIGVGYDSEGPVQVNVRMRNGGSWSNLLPNLNYGKIPGVDVTGITFCPGFVPDTSIVHMRTIRIPLADFDVKLNNVNKVQIRFDDDTTTNRELYLDNIEFVGGSSNVTEVVK